MKFDYFQAKAEIQKGKLLPLYLVYGENTYLVCDLERIIRHSLSRDDREVEVFSSSGTTLAQAVETIASPSLFGGPRLISCKISGYREVEPFLPAIGRYVTAPPADTCLFIHCHSKEPPSSRLEMSLGGTSRIVSCPKLVGTDLEKWIADEMSKFGLRHDPLLVRTLIRGQGDNADLHWLSGEIEKLYLEASDPNSGGTEASDSGSELYISRGPRTSAFLVTDAIGARDIPAAMMAAQEAFAWGEPPLRLCFMMARHLMLLLRAKVLSKTPRVSPVNVNPDDRRAAKSDRTREKAHQLGLGISPFEEKKIMGQARRFSEEEIVTLLKMLLEAESAIKSGLMEGDVALEVFLARASRVLRSGFGIQKGFRYLT
ncbi:MAG TPA: DNA polymerase III subunit delta [Clostridia bacterium]|nr:DNA polymerase III subunit delta [Clostridia bacterium]